MNRRAVPQRQTAKTRMHVMTSLCTRFRLPQPLDLGNLARALVTHLCSLSGSTQRAFDFLFFVLSYFGSKTVAIFDSTSGAVEC